MDCAIGGENGQPKSWNYCTSNNFNNKCDMNFKTYENIVFGISDLIQV